MSFVGWPLFPDDSYSIRVLKLTVWGSKMIVGVQQKKLVPGGGSRMTTSLAGCLVLGLDVLFTAPP